ncbi:MAG: SDR family NAD(P)-dependent oxidoreductase, partial [Sciscionella sp.]
MSGSGRGIGREIARKLAAAGASVVVNDLDDDVARQTAADITDAGGTAVTCVGSVTDADFADRFVQTAVDNFGGLHIVVNNAGYTWDNVVQKMTDQQWHDILDVHLTAPFRILRAAQPVISSAVKDERAAGTPRITRKIVNISSVAGTAGNAGQANYGAAKAGLTGLTKVLAKEWGRYDVTVNCVAYGFIRTR